MSSYSRKLFFVLVFFTVIVTAGCGKSSGGSNPSTYMKVFSIGEPVTFERQVFKVTALKRNYQPSSNDPYAEKVPAGQEWIVINIKIENNAKHAYTFHKEYVFLEDGNKNVYRGTLLRGNLRPGFISMGDWLQGGILYKIPAGTTRLTMYYQPKYLQKKNQIIKIKIL